MLTLLQLNAGVTKASHRHRCSANTDWGDAEAAWLSCSARRQALRALIDELGFDTVDAGSLADSWRQQPDTPVYGLREGVAGVTEALAEASPERPAAFRG